MYGYYSIRVFPFGYLRVNACLQLVVAFRSLPRPSSALSAKASTVCPYSLDLFCTCCISTAGPSTNNTANVSSVPVLYFCFFSCKETVFLNLLGRKLFLPFTEKLFHYTLCSFQRTLPGAFLAGYGLDLFSPILLREKAPSKLNSRIISSRRRFCSSLLLLRKEVIQPHLPIRLPCYDFTPIIDPTFDSSLL